MPDHHALKPEAFALLRDQIATASARCSDDQLLTLADGLHDSIRRRSASRANQERAWRSTTVGPGVEHRT